MSRPIRVLAENRVYHVFNRRTDCQLLFPSHSASDSFLELIERGVERYEIRICAYCVMDTHWHQAIWVREGGGATAVVRYLQWLSARHATQFRFASKTRGFGHVYQDRYKAKVVNTIDHYYTLVRYIEANPLAAGLVTRAETWRWSSLAERLTNCRRILTEGPLPIPTGWPETVNAHVLRDLGAAEEDMYEQALA